MTPLRQSGLVTVVTPTLDAAAFLAETMQSVLGQSYPHIEYVVVDGGSSDGTLQVAGQFGERVSVLSAPGLTQAQAVNFAFRHACGEFFTFVNADDVLMPNAIASLVSALRATPEAPYAYGDAVHIDAEGTAIGAYPTAPFSAKLLAHVCFICQPATLLRADVYERCGGLNEELETAFDYDLWIRLARTEGEPVKLDTVLAKARMHLQNKSLRRRNTVYGEVFETMRRHYGYVPFNWVHAYAGYLVDGKDYFFEPPAGSVRRTLLTLVLGLKQNKRRRTLFLREFVSETVRLRNQAKVMRA